MAKTTELEAAYRSTTYRVFLPTGNHIEVTESEFAIIGNRIFNKRIAIAAIPLSQIFIAFSQVVCCTLNKCRHKRKVFYKCLAVRQVEVVIQLVIGAAEANHFYQVHS